MTVAKTVAVRRQPSRSRWFGWQYIEGSRIRQGCCCPVARRPPLSPSKGPLTGLTRSPLPPSPPLRFAKLAAAVESVDSRSGLDLLRKDGKRTSCVPLPVYEGRHRKARRSERRLWKGVQRCAGDDIPASLRCLCFGIGR